MNILNLITHNLYLTYTANDNRDRTDAEKVLSDLQKQSEFVAVLIHIIDSNELEDPLKTAAANYLKNYFSRKSRQKCIFDTNICLAVLKLLQSNIAIKLKKIIMVGLQLILNKEINIVAREHFSNDLLKKLKMKSGDFNYDEYLYLILYGQFMQSMSYDQSTYLLTKYTFSYYVTIGINIINELEKKLESMEDIRENIILVRQLMEFFKIHFKREDFKRHEVFRDSLKSEHFQAVLFNIISITHAHQENFMCICLIGEYSEAFNISKSIALFILEVIIRSLYSSTEDRTGLQKNPYLIRLEIYQKIFLQSLCKILTQPYFSLHKLGIYPLLENMFKLLATVMCNHEYYKFYCDYRNTWLNSVFLPLFYLSAEEKENFQTNPEELIDFVEHIVQKSGTRKQYNTNNMTQETTLHISIARFIVCFMKHIDGALLHFFKSALNFLKDNPDSSPEKQNYLIILSVVNYNMVGRKDLQTQLLQYSITWLTSMTIPTQRESKITTCITLLMVCRYLPYFAEINREFVGSLFRFSMKLLEVDSDGSMQITCLEMLESIFKFKNEAACKENLEHLFKIFMAILGKSTASLKLYPALLQLIRQNINIRDNQQLMSLCVFRLLEKIRLELKKKQKHSEEVINKCWNILRDIGCCKYIKHTLIPFIEPFLESMFEYLQNPQSIDFQQDLILIYNNFTHQTKVVSDSCCRLVTYLPLIFKKYKLNFHNLFHFINDFIIYGAQKISKNILVANLIVEISFESVFATGMRNINQVDNCHGVMILQNLLWRCGESFPKEFLQMILENLQKRLNEHIKFNFFKSNIIACIMLTLCRCYKNLEENKFQLYLQSATRQEYLGIFDNEYSCKMYILSVCELLVDFNNPTIQKIYMELFLSCLGIMEDLQGFKKLMEQQEEEQLLEEEIEDYNIVAKQMKSKITELEYYTVFQGLAKRIKSKQPGLWIVLLEKLNQKNKEFLKRVLMTEMVEDAPKLILKLKR